MEENGIEYGAEKIKDSVIAIPGDNLESHSVGRFTKIFGWKYRFLPVLCHRQSVFSNRPLQIWS